MAFSPPYSKPEGKSVEFRILVKPDEGDPIEVWDWHVRYTDDDLDRAVVFQCDDAQQFAIDTLRAAGINDAAERVQLMMTTAEIEEMEVGPAINHIPFMIERYSESPHKYDRPPQCIRPGLIRAMMRSHLSILALEAAQVERAEAQGELEAWELDAGMHEPSIWD